MIRIHPLGLCAAVIVFGGSVLQGADIDRFVPDDTEAVLAVNVEQLLGSNIGKKYLLESLKQTLSASPAVDKTLKDLGFDPFRDAQRLVYAQSAAAPQRSLLILHGRFDGPRIQTWTDKVRKDFPDTLRLHKVPNGQGDSSIIYEILKTPDSRLIRLGDKPIFLALIDKAILLASQDKDAVATALEKAAGRKKTTLQYQDLQTLLAEVDGRQTAWLAARGEALVKPGLFGNAGLKAYAPKVEVFQGGVRIAEDIRIEVVVTASSIEAARDLDKAANDALNLTRGILTKLADDQKLFIPVRDLANSIQIGREGKTLTARGKVTAASLEQATK
jgi:hypothetical protein